MGVSPSLTAWRFEPVGLLPLLFLPDGNGMSRYNPDIHRRRSIRLKNYGYSRDGAYFLTLCTFDRGCHFEQFEQLRRIVEAQWHSIPERFPGVVLDAYVIMPNHFHGIIVLGRETLAGIQVLGIHNQGTRKGCPYESQMLARLLAL